jgi:hypothetical protein
MRICLAALCLVLAACGSDAPPSPIGLPASDNAFCVSLGADYMNNVGAMAVLSLPSQTLVKNVLKGTVSSDPVLRAYGQKLYIVNRSDANITIVDTTTWTVDRQFSTGAGTNPQDVAVAGTKAYVALLGAGALQVWDLATAATAPSATVDLSSYDPDGVPNASSVAVVGDRAYVALELLDTQTPPKPRGKGKMVVVDTKTNKIVADFDLENPNPVNFMFARGDKLLVSTVPTFGKTDGCLEQVATAGTAKSEGCLVQNSDLMGTVNAIAVGASDLYVTVDQMFVAAQLRSLGSDGKPKPGAISPSSETPSDLALAPDGLIVYADQAASGLRVFDVAKSQEITTAAIDSGIAPVYVNGIVCLPR